MGAGAGSFARAAARAALASLAPAVTSSDICACAGTQSVSQTAKSSARSSRVALPGASSVTVTGKMTVPPL